MNGGKQIVHKEYVASRFDNEIFNEISSYLINNKDRLTLRLYNVEYIDWIELQDATVKHVQINDLPGSEIEFDILVEADIYVQQRSNRYGETMVKDKKWDSEVLGLVASIYKYQGKQELYLKQRPRELNKLIEIAKIQNCSRFDIPAIADRSEIKRALLSFLL